MADDPWDITGFDDEPVDVKLPGPILTKPVPNQNTVVHKKPQPVANSRPTTTSTTTTIPTATTTITTATNTNTTTSAIERELVRRSDGLREMTRKLCALLSDGAHDDIVEFASVLHNIVSSLERCSASSSGLSSQFVQVSRLFEELESLLAAYAKQVRRLMRGGRLKRLLTSARHRRKLEKLSYLLDESRVQLNALIGHSGAAGSSNSKQNSGASNPSPGPGQGPATDGGNADSVYQLLPFDRAGAEFWAKAVGSTTFKASCDRLIDQLQSHQAGFGDTATQAHVRQILDSGKTGWTNVYKWVSFCQGFGPFEQSAANTARVCSAPWFHWFLGSAEAARLLAAQPARTFLIRFSKSQPGQFAVCVKSGDSGSSVSHARVDPAVSAGATPAPAADTPPGTRFVLNGTPFPSLHAMVEKYQRQGFLGQPFTAGYYREPWFQGDLSELEADELLDGAPPGTFLVRFNLDRPGEQFVVSHVTADQGAVVHTAVNGSDAGSSPQQLRALSFDFSASGPFSSLTELVAANRTILKHAFVDEALDAFRDSVLGDQSGGDGSAADPPQQQTTYGNIAGTTMMPAALPTAGPADASKQSYGAIPGNQASFKAGNSVSPVLLPKKQPSPAVGSVQLPPLPTAAGQLASQTKANTRPVAAKSPLVQAQGSSAGQPTPGKPQRPPKSTATLHRTQLAPSCEMVRGSVVLAVGQSSSGPIPFYAQPLSLDKVRFSLACVNSYAPVYVRYNSSDKSAATMSIECDAGPVTKDITIHFTVFISKIA